MALYDVWRVWLYGCIRCMRCIARQTRVKDKHLKGIDQSGLKANEVG